MRKVKKAKNIKKARGQTRAFFIAVYKQAGVFFEIMQYIVFMVCIYV
jgi:uncharacterized protein YmfQ (DUF2313 family)